MIELIYNIDDFLKLVEERNIPKDLIRLGYVERRAGLASEVRAILTAPAVNPVTGEPMVMMCVVSSMMYDYLAYIMEVKENKVGDERKKVKAWMEWVEKTVEQKLGFKPVMGRWKVPARKKKKPCGS